MNKLADQKLKITAMLNGKKMAMTDNHSVN